jgi:hypothetical protein
MEDAEKGMRYPAKETAVKHERIVKEASRLSRERGFETVSLGEVMKNRLRGRLCRGWFGACAAVVTRGQ